MSMRSLIWGAFYIATLGLLSQPALAQLTGSAGANTLHPASYVQCYATRLQKVSKEHDNPHNVSGTPLAWLYLGASSRWATETFQPEVTQSQPNPGPTTIAKRLDGFTAACSGAMEYSCSGQTKTFSCIEKFGEKLESQKTSCENQVDNQLRQCQANPRNQDCRQRFDKNYWCEIEQSRLDAFDDQRTDNGVLACYNEVNRCSESSTNIADLDATGTGVLTGNAGAGGTPTIGGSGDSIGNIGGGSGNLGTGGGGTLGNAGSNGVGSAGSSGSTIVSISSITGVRSSVNTRSLSGSISFDRNGKIVTNRSTYGDRRAVERAVETASTEAQSRSSGSNIPETPTIVEKATCSPSLRPSRSQVLQATDGSQTFAMSTIDGFRGANTLHVAGVVFELADRDTEYISLSDANFPHVRISNDNLQSTKLLIACGEYDKVHIGGSSNLRIVDSINDAGESVLSIDNEADCRPYSGLTNTDDFKYSIVQIETHGDPSTFARSLVLSGIDNSHRFVCRQTLNITRTQESFATYLDEQFPQ